MSYVSDVLKIAKNINAQMESLTAPLKVRLAESNMNELYDTMITNKSLRRKTEKLFKDGHHVRAVEEAYKLIDNLVKKKADLEKTDFTGAALMNKVFSPKNTLLKLNEGKSSSEQNEQAGYMQIYAGCMTGIRNPRAHDTDWEDTEERALQLLTFANHLIERVHLSIKE